MKRLIANMNVDSECRDAKHICGSQQTGRGLEVLHQSFTDGMLHTDTSDAAEQLEILGEDLAVAVNNEDLEGYSDTCESQLQPSACKLNYNEDYIQMLVQSFYVEQQEQLPAKLVGNVVDISETSSIDLKTYSKRMNKEKRK